MGKQVTFFKMQVKPGQKEALNALMSDRHQNKQYEEMRALLASDPEWFDCDVLAEEGF